MQGSGGPDLDVLVPTCGRPHALAVTLAGLAAQPPGSFRLVLSDQTEPPSPPAYDDPAAAAVLRVLRRHGHDVVLLRNLPRRGMAQQRCVLLEHARAPYVLFLDSDVLLDPGVPERLLAALRTLGCGFAGAAVQGLSHVQDVRPHEQTAFELWDGPVVPERIRKGQPEWERWRLHNAANLVHLEDRLRQEGRLSDGGWLAYKAAWIGGCVLFDRRKLLAAGGYDFWPQLPPGHRGEDVAAQLRVAERYGGAGVLPSGAWHLELPSTVTDRSADAYALVLEQAQPRDVAAGSGG